MQSFRLLGVAWLIATTMVTTACGSPADTASTTTSIGFSTTTNEAAGSTTTTTGMATTTTTTEPTNAAARSGEPNTESVGISETVTIVITNPDD